MSRNVQPFPSPWHGRIGTTASADFCEHDAGHPGRPAFRASPTRGYASQTSPNKHVNFRCTSSPSTLESVGNGFVVHGQLTSGSLSASMAFLYVASQLWRERCRLLHRSRVRRLPSHGFLCRDQPAVGARLRLVLRLKGYIWYTVLRSIPVFVQGTCTPQVHAHVGRTGEREPPMTRVLRS